jgi:hypothetical protein
MIFAEKAFQVYLVDVLGPYPFETRGHFVEFFPRFAATRSITVTSFGTLTSMDGSAGFPAEGLMFLAFPSNAITAAPPFLSPVMSTVFQTFQLSPHDEYRDFRVFMYHAVRNAAEHGRFKGAFAVGAHNNKVNL